MVPGPPGTSGVCRPGRGRARPLRPRPEGPEPGLAVPPLLVVAVSLLAIAGPLLPVPGPAGHSRTPAARTRPPAGHSRTLLPYPAPADPCCPYPAPAPVPGPLLPVPGPCCPYPADPCCPYLGWSCQGGPPYACCPLPGWSATGRARLGRLPRRTTEAGPLLAVAGLVVTPAAGTQTVLAPAGGTPAGCTDVFHRARRNPGDSNHVRPVSAQPPACPAVGSSGSPHGPGELLSFGSLVTQLTVPMLRRCLVNIGEIRGISQPEPAPGTDGGVASRYISQEMVAAQPHASRLSCRAALLGWRLSSRQASSAVSCFLVGRSRNLCAEDHGSRRYQARGAAGLRR